MSQEKNQPVQKGEGYVYVVYGKLKYLEHAVVSASTIRRYDTKRPIALICQPHHRDELRHQGLEDFFDLTLDLQDGHDSIVGFKHNVHHYMPFERNLYLDSDIVWCRDPDPLWHGFQPFGFTITGIQKADYFFGAPKGIGIVRDYLLRRRERTLKRFGLTYLSRVQSGVMYARDPQLTRQVCERASQMLDQIDRTHFQSRKKEKGRNLESCEWSLAMAMSDLNIPVYPWLNGHESPQLDFIGDIVEYDEEFEKVVCTFHTHPFVYSLRGVKSDAIRRMLYAIFGSLPGYGDYQKVTPYCLHFGWLHQKEPFLTFADRKWNELTGRS